MDRNREQRKRTYPLFKEFHQFTLFFSIKADVSLQLKVADRLLGITDDRYLGVIMTPRCELMACVYISTENT